MSDRTKQLGERTLWLTQWATKNRRATYFLTLLIVLFGVYTYIHIAKEQFPEIIVPTFIISTPYPGNSPQDIENLVTIPIEKELKSLSGIKKIQSTSYQDFSIIRVEFHTDIAVEEAKDKVRDAVDKAKSELPDDLPQEPQIKEINFAEIPIMAVNVAGPFSLEQLKRYAETLQDKIEQLPEITRVDLIGGLERTIFIEVDPYKLKAYQVSLSDIAQAVKNENLNISAGTITVDNLNYSVRLEGEFTNVYQLENLIIRSLWGKPVYLRDIAIIRDSYKEQESYARLDGQPVITLMVIKKAGENLIAASEKIQNIIQEARKTLPKQLKIVITNDQSIRTNNTLNNLLNSIIIGFFLVTLILMFFMGLTNALFVGLAVPLASLVAFSIFPLMDITLNIVVLFAFLLALGILVDNSIVVVENIYRLYDKGRNPILESARYGAAEVFLPVLSGTLTTLAPFFPLLFWESIVGEFIKFLPITLIITLSASLLVAFVINPVFAVDFMKPEERRPSLSWKTLLFIAIVVIVNYLLNNPFIANLIIIFTALYLLYVFVFYPLIIRFQSHVLPAISRYYGTLIQWALDKWHPIAVVAATFLLLFLAFALVVLFPPKVIFFPKPDPNFIYVYLRLPEGTDVAYTDSVAKVVENRIMGLLKGNPDVESVICNVALGANDPREMTTQIESHKAKITVAFVPYSERKGPSTRIYLEKIRNILQDLPGVKISVEQEQAGPPTGKPINIQLRSENFALLIEKAQAIKRYLDTLMVPGIERMQMDLALHVPQLIVKVDREKANREGIFSAQIGDLLRTALYGKEIAKYKELGEDYPIVLRYQKPYREDIQTLLNTEVRYMDMAIGRKRHVPISTLAEVYYKEAVGTVNRIDLKRVVSFSSNVLQGYNATEINQRLYQAIKKQLKDTPKIEVVIAGEQQEQQEAQAFLQRAFMISVALILVILITLFNSIGRTILILFQILFSVIGVFLGFVFFGKEVSVVMVGVGMVALAGIVVNNGILLIEFADQLMQRGLNIKEAIIEASKIRLTPVLLTATSTILGMVPMAVGFNINFITLLQRWQPNIYFGGDNVAFWGPLSMTIIYGLSFATLLTLIVLPSFFYLYLRFKGWIKRD